MKRFAAVLLAGIMLMAIPTNALFGHCDSMNGPVVTAARKALETGNVNLVLIWVQKSDESQIKLAFQKTLAVRKLGADAGKLADMYFFETLVRIHRAGEGVAYTGLKPSEARVEPGIKAADQALENGSVDQLLQYLTESIQQGIRERFEHVMAKGKFKSDDIEAGREYVMAYVEFIHYAEGLYESSKPPAEGHIHEGEQVGMQEHKH